MRDVKSLGAATVTFRIGSSSTGLQLGMASLMAMRAAILNDISELSTRVILAVDQRHFEIDDLLAERAFLQIVAQPLLDGGDEVARHHAAHDPVDEAEARAARQRPDLDLDVGELAVAAGLALVARVLRGAGLDRLAIGDARRIGVDGDVVAAASFSTATLRCISPWPSQQQLVRLGAQLEGERGSSSTILAARPRA